MVGFFLFFVIRKEMVLLKLVLCFFIKDRVVVMKEVMFFFMFIVLWL